MGLSIGGMTLWSIFLFPKPQNPSDSDYRASEMGKMMKTVHLKRHLALNYYYDASL
jgi:hypothetical protein